MVTLDFFFLADSYNFVNSTCEKYLWLNGLMNMIVKLNISIFNHQI